MKNKIIEFPTEWEELKPGEWTYLSKLFFEMIGRRGVTLVDVKREWIRFVLRNRSIKPNSSLQYYKLVHDLLGSLDWLFAESEQQVGINFTSTTNLLPVYNGLYGPADHGADLTFGEYRNAIQMMNAYTIEHDGKYLQYLAGMLYRPKLHGLREEFNSDYMYRYIKRAARMPRFVKYTVYLWLAAFSKFLLEGTFVIDGNEVCFAEIFESRADTKSSGKNLGLTSILYSMAESGVFGTIDEVDKTPLLAVMMKLLNDKYKVDELKEMYKKK